MASVSTHVLDAVTGRPAVGVSVTLSDDAGTTLADGTTDDDGRIGALAADMAIGTYRIRFDTGAWFAERGVETFYPEVVVTFRVADSDAHQHVPILLSPFAFSTYRGS
ncbi:hydroxyisourate hydrolase [uncultured Williamsia sp.]|uniref:hydroxyisourate hydrolase n=1 Tax=uncultured Williamsia sp. TaxID=259311 RepID=UPI00263187C9|nr:hydroxyisourate hydrolase [uncultured Williamsia sp.]